MQSIDVTGHSRLEQLFPLTTVLQFICCSLAACKEKLLMAISTTYVYNNCLFLSTYLDASVMWVTLLCKVLLNSISTIVAVYMTDMILGTSEYLPTWFGHPYNFGCCNGLPDGILHRHSRENHKSYKKCFLANTRDVLVPFNINIYMKITFYAFGPKSNIY
jgi:hypothetical protein